MQSLAALLQLLLLTSTALMLPALPEGRIRCHKDLAVAQYVQVRCFALTCTAAVVRKAPSALLTDAVAVHSKALQSYLSCRQ
jgi:hypothetical protein